MRSNYTLNFEILFCVFSIFATGVLGQECDLNGINCISCTSYQKCDSGKPVGPVISCENGNACDLNKLEQCHAKYNCYALNKCTQPGVFPDAEDESSYYVCLNDPTAFIIYEFTCVQGEFFDKTTSMCIPKAATSHGSEISSSSDSSSEGTTTSSTESSSESTTTSSTESSSESTTTSSTESSSESTTTSSTESSSESTTTTSTETSSESTTTTSTESSSESTTTSSTESSSTTSSSSTETTTSTSPGTISTTASPFVCPAPGIFPSPSNCKMYHRCSTSLKLFNYVCPGTSYFNEYLLKCSMIITPACQAQISQNSSFIVTTPVNTPPTPKTTTTSTPATTTTTTTPSTTTTTIPSTTTTTITTPSTTTTTTTTQSTTTTTTIPSPTPPGPFSCPMSGTFANPISCKTYYRCSTSGKSFMYICPGETYFNEFTKRCSLQMTSRCQKLLQN